MALQPYIEKFTYEDAAHLARRTMFGATPDSIAELEQIGLFASVERLLSFDTAELSNNPFHPNTAEKQGQKRALTVSRWIYEMTNSPYPFRERITFFWHNHFVIESKKVNYAKGLEEYLAILREHSLGNFENLAQKISFSPAMLRYLDNEQNQKEHPNENFARELMELFTLGIGNYTEKDVTEAARALTGWTIIKARQSPRRGEAVFRTGRHDSGQKTIFGLSGNYKPEDVVKLCCHHEATANFIAKKLWLGFVSDTEDEKGIEQLASSFSAAANLSDLYFELFTSQKFYDAKYSMIKSPVDYLIGTFRALGLNWLQERAYGDLARILTVLGQQPLNPPNVAGWKGGRTWINDSALLDRINVAKRIFLDSETKILGNHDSKSLELALLAKTDTEIFELLGNYDISQQAFLTAISPEYNLI